MTPPPKQRADLAALQARDLGFPVYRDRVDCSPRLAHATKYDASHLGRSARNYDDRYNDIRPTYRGKPQLPAASPMIAPVRILRNPDRERERARESRDDFIDGHGVSLPPPLPLPCHCHRPPRALR